VERETWARADLDRLASAAEVSEPATYVELLSRLAPAQAFVGNDSGPGHLAGILGVPTVSIFGPTDPARWRPLGPRVSTVMGSPIDAIDVEQVYSTLSALEVK
jgi:ADP-heptose:LPS heptosyltransferase